MPHSGELAPTAAEEQNAAIEAAHAIQTERHADTLGAMSRLRHNLGRNALILSSGVAIAYGTALNGVNWQALPTGAVYEAAAGVVVGGGIYAAARLKERRSVNRAEEHQDAIRDALDEPVDLIKTGKRSAVLRWYGCDEQYLPESATANDQPISREISPAAAARRLESIVAFAKEAGISEVALSAKVLDIVPETDAKTFGKVIPNDALLKQKRVKVTDNYVDAQVLRCTVAGAEALLDEIQTKTQQNSLRVVTDLLRQASPRHPILAHADALLTKGDDGIVTREAKRVLQAYIEQTASNGTSMVRRASRTDGTMTLGREYLFARLDGRELDRVGVTQTQGAGEQQTYYKGRQGLLATTGFETLEALITDTVQKRHVLASHVLQERAEIAAWLLLQDTSSRKQEAAANVSTDSATDDIPPTTFEQLVKESPRTFLRGLRRKGRHAGETPWIEYRRNHAKPFRRAAGALAMFTATTNLALAAGHEAHQGINSNFDHLERQYAVSHGYKDGVVPYQADDGFWHYAEHDGSVRARINQIYNDADSLDTDILDVMAAHLPDSVKARITPSADSTWVYRKESALKNLSNAYTDGIDRAAVGDVTTNRNGIAWTLTPTGGVSTKGYWAQSMQSFVDASENTNGLLWTPPYREFGIEYDPTPYGQQLEQGGLNQQRVVPLQDPETLSEAGGYIKVEGQRLLNLGSGTMSRIMLRGEDGSDTGYDAFALPVLVGGDIMAAKAEMYTLGENHPLGENDVKVVQLQNGMFYMLMDDSTRFTAQTYVQISYWVKPNAGTATPVHADTPLSMAGGNGTTVPFTEVMSNEDALRVWRQLSGNPNATTLPTTEEAAAAIRHSKQYSFTPYEDAHIALSRNEPSSVSEGLATIGELSTTLPTANCNVAATTELLASRGQAEDGSFINVTTGYHNDGDDVLKTGEAHMWLTSSQLGADHEGKIIDGTPPGQGRDSGDSENFDPNANPTDDLLNKLEKGAAGLALAGFMLGLAGAGRKYGPPTVRRTKASIAEAAAGKLRIDPLQDPEAAANMHKLLNIAGWIHYAPEGSKLNEQDLPADSAETASRDLAKRYAALPVTSAKQMRTRITQLEQAGRLAISGQTRRQLISLARNHKRAQAAQKTA